MNRRKTAIFADEVDLYLFDPFDTQQNDDESQLGPQPVHSKKMNNINTNFFFQQCTYIITKCFVIILFDFHLQLFRKFILIII